MENTLTDAYSAQHLREQGHQLIDLLADHLARTHADPTPRTIAWREPAEELRFWQADFSQPRLTNPLPLFQQVLERSVNLHSRGYAGHQAAIPLPVGVLATTLASVLGNGMAVYEMGMAGNALEHIVTTHLAQTFGLGPAAGGIITSGGTLGNLTALLAARAAATSIWEEGAGGEQLAILVSEQAHYCIDRAARTMGLGSAGIVKVPVNARYQMRTDLLEECWQAATAQGRRVFCVVGSACSTATGSYDDLAAIAAFARRHGLWFHVDGAHGAAAAFSPQYAPLVQGIAEADSVVVDFHKMMLLPSLATAVLFRRDRDADRTFAQQAHYLWAEPAKSEWYNSGKRTFECTKPMTVVGVYAVLRQYGDDLFRQNVEQLYGLAQRFAEMVVADGQFELACPPQSNIVCFRYAAAADALNQHLLRYLLNDGRFYIVSTQLSGRLWLRVSLMQPLTMEADLALLLQVLKQEAARSENAAVAQG
ncbi:MAG: aminotransferase class I/II-fold pyridoxal phosphate-dependent enzyme [Hymenobacter sp.]|nr:aminotransferase class I/II-fold pyridoxal phosphate-dependent enzyme [Hymenobacter sp.]